MKLFFLTTTWRQTTLRFRVAGVLLLCIVFFCGATFAGDIPREVVTTWTGKQALDRFTTVLNHPEDWILPPWNSQITTQNCIFPLNLSEGQVPSGASVGNLTYVHSPYGRRMRPTGPQRVTVLKRIKGLLSSDLVVTNVVFTQTPWPACLFFYARLYDAEKNIHGVISGEYATNEVSEVHVSAQAECKTVGEACDVLGLFVNKSITDAFRPLPFVEYHGWFGTQKVSSVQGTIYNYEKTFHEFVGEKAAEMEYWGRVAKGDRSKTTRDLGLVRRILKVPTIEYVWEARAQQPSRPEAQSKDTFPVEEFQRIVSSRNISRMRTELPALLKEYAKCKWSDDAAVIVLSRIDPDWPAEKVLEVVKIADPFLKDVQLEEWTKKNWEDYAMLEEALDGTMERGKQWKAFLFYGVVLQREKKAGKPIEPLRSDPKWRDFVLDMTKDVKNDWTNILLLRKYDKLQEIYTSSPTTSVRALEFE